MDELAELYAVDQHTAVRSREVLWGPSSLLTPRLTLRGGAPGRADSAVAARTPAPGDGPVPRTVTPALAEVAPGSRRRRPETAQQPGKQGTLRCGTGHVSLLRSVADDVFVPHDGKILGAETQLTQHRLGVLAESRDRVETPVPVGRFRRGQQ